MSRPMRIEYPGAVYHVTSRGNARQWIYRSDEDRSLFLDVLSRTLARRRWLLHAYCLMTNHYHLLVETPEANLSAGMRQLNGEYTQAFNRRHGRVGHAFQGRFQAVLVEKERHLLELCRYVALNPVRAKMTKVPEAWPWSSHAATAGLAPPPPFLETRWVLGRFGKDDAKARRRYAEFVAQGAGESPLESARGGLILGTEAFVEEVNSLVGTGRRQREYPGDQRAVARTPLPSLLPLAVLGDLTVRNERIGTAVLDHGYKLAEVGHFLGLHYATVSRIVKAEESRRSSMCQYKT